MKNQKTKKIFWKIFRPIAVLLVLFAIASFAFNYFSIDRFVKIHAEESITEAFNDIKKQLNDFKNSGAKDFTLKESSNLISKGNDTKVFVYDKDYKDLAIFDNSVYKDSEMTSFISSLLMNYELEENTLTTINFNNREYLANTYEASSGLNINERYFVVVQDMTEKTVLLQEGLRNMLLMQIIILLFAVFTVYRIAIDLSKPITELSEESNKYIVGKGVTISEKQIDITEVESLRSTLYNMQKKIDEEDKRKNTIYENVAHDLRTPLVSILGYADGIKSGIVKDTKKACDVIIKTGNQLKEMIENILILSRFDNETYTPTYEDIELISLLKEQIDLIKIIDNNKKISLVYNDKNITKKLESEYKLLTINTDKKLLTRIIQNLLSNAIKYSNSEITVAVVAKPTKPFETLKQQSTEINITNDGPTLNKKNLNNIFTRY